MIDKPDLDIVPLGTILPFSPADELPDTWHKLDGSILDAKEYPELYKRIWATLDIWLKVGGNASNSTIVLPKIDTVEEAMELAFGYHSDPPMDIVLAIKVNRE